MLRKYKLHDIILLISKGSNNYKRAKRALARLHIKIANTRRDLFHKLVNQIAKSYEFVVIEDLNIKAMQKLWGKKISDAAINICRVGASTLGIGEVRPAIISSNVRASPLLVA